MATQDPSAYFPGITPLTWELNEPGGQPSLLQACVGAGKHRASRAWARTVTDWPEARMGTDLITLPGVRAARIPPPTPHFSHQGF